MSGLVHGLVSGTSRSHDRTDGFESALKRVKYLVAVAALHGWEQQMWQRSPSLQVLCSGRPAHGVHLVLHQGGWSLRSEETRALLSAPL